jgi:hypothetical protein
MVLYHNCRHVRQVRLKARAQIAHPQRHTLSGELILGRVIPVTRVKFIYDKTKSTQQSAMTIINVNDNQTPKG